MNIVVVFYFLLLTSAVILPSGESCETVCKYGTLKGKFMLSRKEEMFCAYVGVPYAAPPINELRFSPPSSPSEWKGVLDATTERDICLQQGYLGSEDCLYLNVFTHTVNTTIRDLSPVLVYIHGGGFFMGSSTLTVNGPEYIMDTNVVLVTIQYRLGAFGFLSTGDKVIPGNMGLKDQVKALEWVQDNISVFGGDPDRVTLFGNSAGGASVHLHMMSPRSQHLFTRGISQSGTALSGFSFIGQQFCRKTTENLAVSLNCSTVNSSIIHQCLLNKNSTDILRSYDDQLKTRYDFSEILFRPVIEPESDHAFLTRNPKNCVTTKPWMVGVNANEGIFRLTNSELNKTIGSVKSSFYKVASQLLLFEYFWNISNESANLAEEFYFKNISSMNDMITSLEQIITDSWFIWPTERAIKLHKGPLYYYLYDHKSEHSFSEVYGCVKGFGVSHVDELISLFSHIALFPKLNEQDTNVSKVIVNMWVNFASEGNPTPRPISSDPQADGLSDFSWTQFNSSDSNYIHIERNKLSMKKQIFPKRMQFWNSLTLDEN